MTNAQLNLLMTVARMLSAHQRDHISHPDFSYIDQEKHFVDEAIQAVEAEAVSALTSGLHGGEKS